MKRACVLLSFCLLLSGCSNPFAQRREIEQLLVVQTMGLDLENGAVRLSLASAAGSLGEPRRLSAVGGSVSGAMERIYDASYEQELFCHHVGAVLIGESAADEGIEDMLTYICRSPIMRLDTPIYIVRGGSAQELIMRSGDSSRGISEILENIGEKLERRGGGEFTGSDILRGMLRNGSSLVRTLSLVSSAEDSGAPDAQSPAQPTEDAPEDGGEVQPEQAPEAAQEQEDSDAETAEGYTAAAAGYAVIRDDRLCKYLDPDEAAAADMLLNRGGIFDIELSLAGGTVVLELSEISAEYTPVWDDGGLSRMDVRVSAQYSVLETRGETALESSSYADALTAALETELLSRIGGVLRTEAELKADFLGLAEKAECSSPEGFRRLRQSFADMLPSLELQVTVACRLRHTNDMKDM